ncbi:hypothetical protein K0M31_013386 [Melipona bicolor]|uniref:Uncharacterized protein n=1 Tax=Melipona bicolor TaxID=60889 RepID=A0AA40FIL1_9HYME|nr:hypothetical protein K0M31_013386 [Melipona bicolor]
MLEYPLSSKLLALFSGSFYGTAGLDKKGKYGQTGKGGRGRRSIETTGRKERKKKRKRDEFEEREKEEKEEEEEEEKGNVLGAKTEEGDQEVEGRRRWSSKMAVGSASPGTR